MLFLIIVVQVPARARTKASRLSSVHLFTTTHERGGNLRYHRHGVAFVTLVMSGRYTEVHSLAPVAHSAGGVILHGRLEEHSDYFTDDAECLNFEVRDTTLQEFIADVPCDDRDVRRTADALISAYRRMEDVERAARAMELALRRAVQKPKAPLPQWLEHVLQAFDWTGAEPIGVAAMLAGVHPAYFSRAFTGFLGVTPVAYRQRARVRLASRLVLSSEHSLAAIAAASGFSDQSHLTRTFSESLGMAPSRFRRAFQG